MKVGRWAWRKLIWILGLFSAMVTIVALAKLGYHIWNWLP